MAQRKKKKTFSEWLFSIGQNLSPVLNAIGQMLNVVNGQILNKQNYLLVTLI